MNSIDRNDRKLIADITFCRNIGNAISSSIINPIATLKDPMTERK